MFVQNWISRKRDRDDDDDHSSSSFNEHRSKRRFAALPHRSSPKLDRRASPPFLSSFASQPPPPTITPADSDSENSPTINEPSSFLLPDPLPTRITLSSPCMISKHNSHSNQMSDTPIYFDDFEMADSNLLSPGLFHNDTSTSISGRIPTPIHSSFAPHIRAEKSFRYSDPDFADDEAMVDRFRRGRNLPSPISEGETSPSIITDGLSDMQMEAMEDIERDTPTRKGHSRSKHSLRNWAGFGGELNGNGAGMKRTFTMGYRADCEKCQNKVPGHFSHIITY